MIQSHKDPAEEADGNEIKDVQAFNTGRTQWPKLMDGVQIRQVRRQQTGHEHTAFGGAEWKDHLKLGEQLKKACSKRGIVLFPQEIELV